MPEKDTIFSSKVKYKGIFSFSDLYKFCHLWLIEETGLEILEKKYSEKLKGDQKEIEVEWEGKKKITDYFRFDAIITFKSQELKEVEIVKDGVKVKTNQGSIEVGIKGILVRDYEAKFETTAFKKFMRATYEKWVITSRINEMENKIFTDCNEFLGQVKAYLDLESK